MESLADFLRLNADGRSEPVAEPSVFATVDLSGPAFCRAVISSREYRLSLACRVANGTLAPAVECRILDQAWGKPTERVEVKDTTNRLEDLTVDQLEARAMFLADVARRMRTQDTTVESEAVH